jgi:hypothetical protein
MGLRAKTGQADGSKTGPVQDPERFNRTGPITTQCKTFLKFPFFWQEISSPLRQISVSSFHFFISLGYIFKIKATNSIDLPKQTSKTQEQKSTSSLQIGLLLLCASSNSAREPSLSFDLDLFLCVEACWIRTFELI